MQPLRSLPTYCCGLLTCSELTLSDSVGLEKGATLTNPFTTKSWAPYVVGIGIGMLSWFAFATADEHLANTLQYEHVAAMVQMAVAPDATTTNRYYPTRAAAGL